MVSIRTFIETTILNFLLLTACGKTSLEHKVNADACDCSHDICRDGSCVLPCARTESVCATGCRDLQTDSANCGECGAACDAGYACEAGRCELRCAEPATECGGACRDLSTDRANCGECGHRCEAGQVCDAGQCSVSCQPALTECDGACRDIESDRSNCGECAHACGAGQVCDAGQCALSCQAALTECAGSCRDLQTDRANCGECGQKCATSEVCAKGACKTECPPSLTDCEGTCRDLQGDWANCGACGTACKHGEVCAGGACEGSCGEKLTNCGGTCYDLLSDPKHCGACGAECFGKCAAGECKPTLVVNITRDAVDYSTEPTVSDDGRFVLFRTAALNLAAGSPRGGVLFDRTKRTFQAIDHVPLMTGVSNPILSGNGKYVFFVSRERLSSDDADDSADLYRIELLSGSIKRVSALPVSSTSAGSLQDFAISGDGEILALQFLHGPSPLYIYDLLADTRTSVAVDADGTVPDTDLWRPSISRDGRYVAFDSRALNITPNPGAQLLSYVYDRVSKQIKLAGVSASGVPCNNQCFQTSLSGDGRRIAFHADATNLTEDSKIGGLIVRDFDTGRNLRVSVDPNGVPLTQWSGVPSFSADGRYLAFWSRTPKPVIPDRRNSDLYVYDLQTNRSKRVNVDETGTYSGPTRCEVDYTECPRANLSANGDILVFMSTAGLAPGSFFDRRDVYWSSWKEIPAPPAP